MAQRDGDRADDEERETLERWARRPKSAQALALRCRIVLAAAEGRSNSEIAAELGCNADTVGKWRARFARRGLDGLHDEPRPGKPRTISDEDVERVIVKTLEEQPAERDALVDAVDGRRDRDDARRAISRIWRAFGLKPHQIEAFKLSPDPQFIDKVRDIVGLYLNPPDAAVVLCVDEKSQIQALDRTAPVLPMLPGMPAAAHPRLRAQRHHQPLRGARRRLRAGDLGDDAAAPRRGVPPLPQPDRRHCARRARRARRLDNSSTHKTPAIQRWLVRHPRFTLHFTPTYSSWLNLVERWFAELTTKWIRNAAGLRADVHPASTARSSASASRSETACW